MTIKQLDAQRQLASRDRQQADKELRAMPASEYSTPAFDALVERIQHATRRIKTYSQAMRQLIVQ